MCQTGQFSIAFRAYNGLAGHKAIFTGLSQWGMKTIHALRESMIAAKVKQTIANV